jgi:MFS family permease
MNALAARIEADVAAVLRLPAFRLYAASRLCSGTANSLLQAVILWQVYALSGSALNLGLVGLVGFVSSLLFSLVGGAVVDAYDRRAVLLLSQLVPWLASLAMLGALVTDRVTLPAVYALVLVTSLASSFESPARQVILPSLVARPLFTRAITASSALQSFSAMTGPALGGMLIAVGGVSVAYAAFAALVALSMVLLLRLALPRTSGQGRVELAAIREGLSFVRHRPVLLGSMTLDMFAVLFGGAQALLPIYAVDVLHASALGYGILSSSLQVGTLLMALALVVLPMPRDTGKMLLAAVAAFGVATIVFGVSRSLPLSVLAYAVVGMADQVSMVTRQNTVQLSTPDTLRGRVTAVSSVFINASNELGAMESGLVAAATSATFAVVSGGLACLVVVALIAWRVPTLRRFRVSEVSAHSR